jgi:hypothetical protein
VNSLAIRTLLSCTALAVTVGAGPRSLLADDSPEEIARELAEKMDRCLKSAAESQRKAAERAEKRRREAAEDLSEEQREARENARKEARAAAKRAAKAREDVAEFEEEALDEFDDDVERYVKLHEKAAKALTVPAPGPRATPQQILSHQRALAEAIRALRPAARQGDIFTPDTHSAFKRLIAAELAGRAGAPARRAVLEGNPPVEIDRDDRMPVRLAVNATYPEAAPVSTVPPSVLLMLPPLPEKVVEYRFVNRDLVLRDVGANMIVDFLARATPPLTTASGAAP